jgi:hypothetical protein
LSIALILVLLLAGTAGAAESGREAYEGDLIQRAFDSLGYEREPEPEGKIIERIEIARFPIVEDNDPWPGFLNIFHITTRDHIARQELLFSEGEPYREERVRESARNLRAFPVTFSTVRIAAARGSRPDRVVVLVITKDLWSIRLNSNFSVGGGVFNYLSLMPTEQNFLGYNQQLSLWTVIDRDTFSVGQVYLVPRLLGSRLKLLESLNLRINHQNGKEEGGWGQVKLELPLFSLASEWGFSVLVAFDLGTNRFYQGEDLRQVEVTDGFDTWILPKIYRHQEVLARLVGVRSFGLKWKTDLELGLELHSFRYRLAPEIQAQPEAAQRAFSQAVLPLEDQSFWLKAAVHFYQADFRRLKNIQSYGLSEDFRLGPDLSLAVGWANPNSPTGAAQALTLEGKLAWLFMFGQDLLSLQGTLGVRLDPHHQLSGVGTDWIDRLGEVEIENASPVLFGLGRLFVRVHYAYSQYSPEMNEFELGGDNTLRGFVSGYAYGERLFNVNAEFRSQPLVTRTLHWGLVLFYDGGDAYGFTRDNDFAYHHSVGLGIRGLFPQFDREVVRLDFGIPLPPDFNDNVLNWVTFTFRQAF